MEVKHKAVAIDDEASGHDNFRGEGEEESACGQTGDAPAGRENEINMPEVIENNDLDENAPEDVSDEEPEITCSKGAVFLSLVIIPEYVCYVCMCL